MNIMRVMKGKEKMVVDCVAAYYVCDYEGSNPANCVDRVDVVISAHSHTSTSDKLLILSWCNPFRFWRVLTRKQSYLFKSYNEAKTFSDKAKAYGDFVCLLKYQKAMD